ncbi:ABC transporter permease [Oligella ureolytica]
MRQILSISMKEVRDGLRNRWVVATTLLLVIFALVLGMLGSAQPVRSKSIR